MNIYQQDILDHYHNPRNTEIPESYTHKAKLENLSCGDEIEVFLQVVDDRVASIGYKAEGCAISIASASKLSEAIVGKTTAEIIQLDSDFILELLGIELTSSRTKCATLGLEAVKSCLN